MSHHDRSTRGLMQLNMSLSLERLFWSHNANVTNMLHLEISQLYRPLAAKVLYVAHITL